MEKESFVVRFAGVALVWAILCFSLGVTGGAANDVGWPRRFDTPKAQVVVYQPQPETFMDDKLTARAAVSVQGKDQNKAEPIFGAVWFSARVATDRDARLVQVKEVKVTRVKFNGATEEQEKKLANLLEQQFPQGDMTLSLDRLLTSLETAQREEAAAAQIKVDPPKIIFSTTPAELVMIDGEPILKALKDSALMQITNSPSLIIFDPAAKTYYLYGQDRWFKTADFKGAWQPASNPPAPIQALTPKDVALTPDTGDEAGTTVVEMPRIIIATEPTELIVTHGQPEFSPIVDGELLYVSNTDGDLFMQAGSPVRYFVLLAGRWYASGALEGPWSYVASNALPACFARIPPDSAKGAVLAQVAGTEPAKEAVLETEIPQTGAIKRSDASLQVSYDGAPDFQPIADTSLSYAVNTPCAVINADGGYYCCNDGVWYASTTATGPWAVCTLVPPVIYTIPPSCPIYNVRYVRVYDYTPDVVYVGYTPGYIGCYRYGGAVVYGTGFYYPAWRGAAYYPRPVTWGFQARYNPSTGIWGYRAGYISPYASVHGGKVEGPEGGSVSWVRANWWGPGGFHSYRDVDVDVNNLKAEGNVNVNRDVTRNVDRTRNNIYVQQANINRNAFTSERTVNAERNVTATRAGTGEYARNDVMVDHEGNVFRKTDQGWQARQGNQWVEAKHESAGERPAMRPETGIQPSALDANRQPRAAEQVRETRPSGQVNQPEGLERPAPVAREAAMPTRSASYPAPDLSPLDREYHARQNGSDRAANYQNYQSMQSAPRSHSFEAPSHSGGHLGGGGGGRRR